MKERIKRLSTFKKWRFWKRWTSLLCILDCIQNKPICFNADPVLNIYYNIFICDVPRQIDQGSLQNLETCTKMILVQKIYLSKYFKILCTRIRKFNITTQNCACKYKKNKIHSINSLQWAYYWQIRLQIILMGAFMIAVHAS